MIHPIHKGRSLLGRSHIGEMKKQLACVPAMTLPFIWLTKQSADELSRTVQCSSKHIHMPHVQVQNSTHLNRRSLMHCACIGAHIILHQIARCTRAVRTLTRNLTRTHERACKVQVRAGGLDGRVFVAASLTSVRDRQQRR